MTEITEEIENTLFKLTKQKVMPNDPVVQIIHGMLMVFEKNANNFTEQFIERSNVQLYATQNMFDTHIEMLADIANGICQELDEKQKALLTNFDEKNKELNYLLTKTQAHGDQQLINHINEQIKELFDQFIKNQSLSIQSTSKKLEEEKTAKFGYREIIIGLIGFSMGLILALIILGIKQ